MFTIINGKVAGVTKGLYTDVMRCAWSSTSISSLDERMFCGGATSGYVYQMDKGSSFDGANIDAFLVFNWNSMKTPRNKKRYRRVSIEMQGDFYAGFSFGYALGYSDPTILQPPAVSYTSSFTGAAYWDTFVWDSFVWDGATLKPTEVDVRGRAENIQVSITSSTNYIYPYTVNSLTFHYSRGRGIR
jgi:hypothetical protein